MSRKIEELAVEVETTHRYLWHYPTCWSSFNQYGGKKIGFIIALIKQHGVSKKDGRLVCGECHKSSASKATLNQN